MATDYYVDPDQVDDSGIGTSWGTAKKHVSAAVGLLSPPLTDTFTIHLKEGATNPYEEDANGEVDIIGIKCIGDGELIISTENWNESNYNDTDSPVGGASFNPQEDKPVELPFSIIIENSNDVAIKGIAIVATEPGDVVEGVQARNNCYDIKIHYCTIEGCFTGVHAYDDSKVTVYNSCILQCNVGVVVMYDSRIFLCGDNYVEDCARFGAAVYMNSTLGFYPWDSYMYDVFTTTIYTGSPKKNYCAVAATINSTVFVKDDEFNLINPALGLVKIIDGTAQRDVRRSNYHGIRLFSRSLLTGANNIKFADSAFNDGRDTVPAERQIVQAAGDDTKVIF